MEVQSTNEEGPIPVSMSGLYPLLIPVAGFTVDKLLIHRQRLHIFSFELFVLVITDFLEIRL